MPRRSIPASAVLCLALAAGCGSAAPAAQPAPTATSSNPQRIQALVADCMKQRGFRYVAWVPPQKHFADLDKAATGDYEAMRKQRAKTGFNVFALLADRSLMEDRVLWKGSDNPNSGIKDQLSKSQRTAYDKAEVTCKSSAVKQVTGKVVKDDADRAEQETKMIKQATERELNGDPKLVELAAAMGDCIKGKGYQVDSLRPTDIDSRGADAFEAIKQSIAKKQGLADPDRPGSYYEPKLSQADARRYLDQEIKAALDDLECGRDFYAAYSPRAVQIVSKVELEFGGSGD